MSDRANEPVRHDLTLLTDDDLFLFNEGTHFRLYEKLGAHEVKRAGIFGTYFAVWAPNAESVSVMGDFNGWDKTSHPLRSGVRHMGGVFPGCPKDLFISISYVIRGYRVDKADPFSFNEISPQTASIVWDLTIIGATANG